jgi:MFS family permease
MLFLQYGMWGVWVPYQANYLQASVERGGLGFTGGQIGWIFALAVAVGALGAPFVAGQLADRYLNAERALAVLLVFAGGVRYALAYVSDFHVFLVLSMTYALVATPTAALTNSISFQSLEDPETSFPHLRIWGTIGWIAAANLFPLLWLATDDLAVNTARVADAFKLSGILSAGYALFAAMALPRTPPTRHARHPLAFAHAFKLFAHRGFFVLALVALPLAVVQRTRFIRIGPFLEDSVGLALKWVGPVQTLGQAGEIVCLLVLGTLLRRLGYRWVLVLGGSAYVVQSVVFAFGHPVALIVAAQALSGVTFACFLVGAYMYVDRVAPEDVRHSAQMVFGYVVLALGPVCAGFYNEYFDRFQSLQVVGGVVRPMQQYQQLWASQAVVALVATLALLAFGQAVAVGTAGRRSAGAAVGM